LLACGLSARCGFLGCRLAGETSLLLLLTEMWRREREDGDVSRETLRAWIGVLAGSARGQRGMFHVKHVVGVGSVYRPGAPEGRGRCFT